MTLGLSSSFIITGGCGFIGTSLIKRLIKADPQARIRVIDNLLVGTKADLRSVCNFTETDAQSLTHCLNKSESNIDLLCADIRDKDIMNNAVKGFKTIVHLAANTGVGPSVEDPREDMESNVIGIFNMLEAARKNSVDKFIFASSGAPVGECRPPIHEEMAPHPVSPYGASKLAGEGYCSAYYRTFGVNTIALRFGNVYGPGSKHKSSVVAKFIKQAMEEEPLEIYGDGNQTRDFIFIDDLVRAILLSAESEKACGETFQIATNKETTVEEMVQVLLPTLEKYGINNINVFHGETRLGDVERNFSDTSKADRLLGWRCEYDLKRGLEKTVQWFLRRNI